MTKPRTCCRTHWEADTDQHAVAVGDVLLNPVGMMMIVCRTCGNKRCPAATDCSLPCTGSNEPGQDGSVYGGGLLERGSEMADDYQDEAAEYECRSCFCLVELPEGMDEIEADLRYCGPCAIVQIEELRDKLANYREQIESLLKARQRYENQLALAAAILQDALPIGQVKHIGLLEVSAGVGELVKQRDELAAAVDELGNRLFGGECGQKIKWRESKAEWWQRCKAAVEAAEKARAT